jgi:hypothetical protein
MMHLRAKAHDGDTRVAACNGYWCDFNTDDRALVDCPDCMAIICGAQYYEFARTAWDEKRKEYVLVSVLRRENPGDWRCAL